jgi:glycosyltransferase involved in cell wall biosynthesis
MPSVSVVIPFHNGSAWIERSLQSAIDQTHPAHEIIVVNDGSNVSESEKLEKLKEKYGFESYTQANSGQSAARNLGVSIANCDYICFLDQDDYFLPSHIEILLGAANLNDTKFGFSYGDLLRVTEEEEIISSTSLSSDHPLLNTHSMISQNMHILPSATLVKKSSFLAVGGFDESLRGYEDDDLFLRFHFSGYSICFTPKPVSAWTLNKNSTSFSESMSRSRYVYFKKLMNLAPSDYSIGESVFETALFPRFAYNFAGDVISSAIRGGRYFSDRVMRLNSFVQEVRQSKTLKRSTRLKYLVATWPLLNLSSRSLAMILRVVLKLAPLFRSLNLVFLNSFLERSSSLKKSV